MYASIWTPSQQYASDFKISGNERPSKTQAGMTHRQGWSLRPNFGVKLMRPGFGPAAELPTVSPASWRYGGCSSPLGSANVIGGNRRAAPGFGAWDRPHSLHQGR
jgi:hypothetical protein